MKIIELLDRSHNHNSFDCNSEPLNSYLRQTARQHNQKGISRTFVLVDTENPKIMIGFFTLCICEVRAEKLTEKLAKKYPLIVPGVKLARLGVDKNWQHGRLKLARQPRQPHPRQGIGEILMVEAMKRAIVIADNAGGIGLFVDAKDEKAKDYYSRYGFVSLQDNPLEMFLPLALR